MTDDPVLAELQRLTVAIAVHRDEIQAAGDVEVADPGSLSRAAVKHEADRRLWAHLPAEHA